MAASYVVLDDDLGYGRRLIRITSGSRAGDELVLVSGDMRGVPRLGDILGEEVQHSDPEALAEELLLSLLDENQRADWDASRRFWVDTKFGKVRLGQLYDLAFRPRNGEALRLCVIPADHQSLPKCDIWTNLLLVLRGDPDSFFRVANWQLGRQPWRLGPVPVSVA